MTANNIWCVGRNYADHAKELGNQVPSEPMIFLKAGSCCVLGDGASLRWPSALGPIHFETELAIQFDAHLRLSHAAVALDFTARETQNKLKAQGHPWTLAKSFHHACGIGPLAPLTDLATLQKTGELKLWVNGELRQHGHFSDMVFTVQQLAEYVCANFPVRPGDLLLTGTPAGVAPLQPGDQLRAEVAGFPQAHWIVAEKS
jgi:2-keto-4-pentenoate hydratase/2-oxohepta-3-ene-1,7-dioic acid hydratase in catechol pathway